MSRPCRFHVFALMMLAFLALLALGAYLLYLGLTTPPFVQPGAKII